MTSRLVDSDAMAVDDTTDTGAAARVKGDEANGARAGARPPFRIHLGRDRQVELDYRRTAIAAGALGLGVLAYRGVTALLTRRRKDEAKPHARTEAQPFPRDYETRTPPGATMPASSTATLVGTDTRAEFVGEPASGQPDAPFVAASGDDDTAGLLVEVTEIDIVTVTPVGTSDDTTTTGADRSALTPEHVPTDLMGDTPPGAGDRAIDAFRPDPTAPVPPEMRDSLRPATGPATGFAGNRGDFASGLSQADGSK